MFNTEQQKQEIKKQEEQIANFYRAKYPNSIGAADAPVNEIKLSPAERYAEDQAVSAGIFKSNQAANQDMLGKLSEVFKARKAGK